MSFLLQLFVSFLEGYSKTSSASSFLYLNFSVLGTKMFSPAAQFSFFSNNYKETKQGHLVFLQLLSVLNKY